MKFHVFKVVCPGGSADGTPYPDVAHVWARYYQRKITKQTPHNKMNLQKFVTFVAENTPSGVSFMTICHSSWSGGTFFGLL